MIPLMNSADAEPCILSFPRLYRAIATSVVDAFCFNNPLIKAALHLACAPFVLELTRLGMKMESIIARDGDLKGASEWLVSIAARDIHIHGAEKLPRDGPLLFVSNHAGLGDAHALLMSSPRRDTKLLANDFGILTGLRQFRRHLIVVEPERPQATIRLALRHLRAGGSLLLYPRGEIEADPGLYPDAARETLADWSRSFTVFARHVPDLAIVPVAVGGVISRRALENAVVRRYRDDGERHFLAATFQMMFPAVPRSASQRPLWRAASWRGAVLRECAAADGATAAVREPRASRPAPTVAN